MRSFSTRNGDGTDFPEKCPLARIHESAIMPIALWWWPDPRYCFARLAVLLTDSRRSEQLKHLRTLCVFELLVMNQNEGGERKKGRSSQVATKQRKEERVGGHSREGDFPLWARKYRLNSAPSRIEDQRRERGNYCSRSHLFMTAPRSGTTERKLLDGGKSEVRL